MGRTPLLVAMAAGGRSQRDLAMALAKARGQGVMLQSAISERTARLSDEDEALQTHPLGGDDMASLCIDTVYVP